jgi:tripartite-type tricarboxylate transporter receptor subunit TctC
MALFASQAGIDMRHVPYKGIAPAVTAVASGEVDSVIASHPALLPMLKGNRVRAIAVTSLEPSELVSDLPAVAQTGLPGYEYELWWGIFAPAGTPPDLVQQMNAAVNKVLKSQDMKQFLATQGAEPTPRSVKALAKLLPQEIERYRKAAKDAGIQPQ